MVTSSRVKDKYLSTYYILQLILEKNVIFQSGVTDGSLELVLQVFTVLSKYPAYSESTVSIISSIHPRNHISFFFSFFRIILNFYEFFTIDAFRKNHDNHNTCHLLLLHYYSYNLKTWHSIKWYHSNFGLLDSMAAALIISSVRLCIGRMELGAGGTCFKA